MAQQQNTETKQFIITEEMIEKAETYIPLAKKTAFAKIVAPECIEALEMSVQKVQSDSTLALPQMYMENAQARQLYLLQFFLSEYLRIENVPEEFSSDDYDVYAGSHPFCQLEKLKNKASTTEIKDKIFNILADYRELKKYLDMEIDALLRGRNDALERFLAGMAIASDPETVKRAIKELQEAGTELKGKLAERAKKRKASDRQKKAEVNTANEQQQSVQSEH